MSIIFSCRFMDFSRDLRCELVLGHKGPHSFELSKNTQDGEQTFQHYWACEHYPSAIENFFRPRHECEWECHKQELEWHHSGKHPMPKSWGGIPRDAERKVHEHQ